MKFTENLDRALAGSILDCYPGNKGGSGVAERIIGQMPPHSLFVEGFAGSAVVFRRKMPARASVLIDEDPNVCHALRRYTAGLADTAVECVCFLEWIRSFRWNLTPTTLVYLDPPYLRSVRSKALYDFEFSSPEQHGKLIEAAKKMNCMVMISGYASPLYKKLLADWRTVEIPTMTHGGKRTEIVWCNFDPPELLHDSRFAGGDYRERENLKRKKKRWASKFAAMSRKERQAVAVALAECDRAAVEMALRSVAP